MKQKLLRDQPAFGYSLYLGSPIAAEALSATGIDFLLVDTQHGSGGHEAVTNCFMGISAGTAMPFARVASNDYTLIGRLLDAGALGIVVPMVESADDARRAADACRLPPVGKRSWGWNRAARYGSDYADQINEQVLVMVQIESINAVENAEAILSTPGVDGCWLGPSDLALSLGIDPRRSGSDERHARALERVLEACRNTGKIPGMSCGSADDALRRAGRGFRFLTAGTDLSILMAGASARVKTLGGG